MRILAVDTSTPWGSVALAEGDDLIGEVRFHSPDRHSSRVMPAIEALLRLSGLPPSDVNGYAVTTGPGPFTGLRVGISTVQGLALGAGRSVVGVSSLDVLAARIRGEAPVLVSMIDAGRGQVYLATYDSEGRPTAEPSVEVPERFPECVPERAAFLGDGCILYKDLIRTLRPASVFPRRSLFLAATLAILAGPLLQGGGGVPPGDLRPLYLRGADLRNAAQPL